MEQDKAIRSELMRTHIAACKASKMKVQTYCIEHQLKPSNYYYWQKKLAPKQPDKFIPIIPPLLTSPVSIIFSNGHRICFENMPPADYVKTLLAPVFLPKTSNHKRKDDGITGCRFNSTGLQPELPNENTYWPTGASVPFQNIKS